jgi:hypothetical protein
LRIRRFSSEIWEVRLELRMIGGAEKLFRDGSRFEFEEKSRRVELNTICDVRLELRMDFE